MTKSLTTLIVLFLGGLALAQQTFVTRVAYDSLGQLERLTYPDGSVVAYTYANEVGIADTVTYSWGADSVVFVEAIELDAAGLVTEVQTPQAVETSRYDDLDRLLEQKLVRDGRTEYWARNFSYGQRDRLSGYERQDPSLTGPLRFEYTEQGALRRFSLGAQSAIYRYDRNGNLTSSSGFTAPRLEVPSYQSGESGFDERNRRSDWDYDAAGRLLADDRNEYTYDQAGRLAMVRNRLTRVPQATYLYDGQGRRVRTVLIEQGTVIYTVRDDAGTILSERLDHSDGPDETINYIHHRGRLIGKMTRIDGVAGQRKTEIASDYLGSPTVIVRDASIQEGPQITRIEYAPYGHQKAALAHEGAPGYTGHEDDGTGLTYMLARSYDSESARFLSPDPARAYRAESPFTLNLYQYASGDPLNRFDPTGLGDLLTGEDVAKQYASQAFREHNDLAGYLWLGASGFVSLGNGISRVTTAHYLNKDDELAWQDYGEAAMNLAEVLPVLKWKQLGKLGKVAKVADVAEEGTAVANSVKTAYKVGMKGEDAVKAVYDIGKKKRFDVNGKWRVPDGTTDDFINEVKNVKKQSFTKQLQDYLEIADREGLKLRLFIRNDTVLSSALEKLVEQERIIVRYIP